MSLRSRFFLPVALFSLALLVACGGGPSNPVPPPSGGFSNSNLSGTYVFSVTGSDSAGFFQAIAGTLAADGNGNITGGTFDWNDLGNGSPALGITVSSGSTYHVTVDGRGIATVNTSAGTFGVDFVLNSKTGGGYITEFDGAGTGSGTLELQTSNTLASSAYTFNLSGTSGTGSNICGDGVTGSVIVPFAMIGTVTMGSGGSISGGVEDVNNNCVSQFGTSGTSVTGGSVSPAPATSTIISGAGTFNFHVYPVDGNHLKFVEIDAGVIVAGDAFPQSSSISGNYVFSVAGFDIPAFGPFSTAGLFVTDGSGNVTASSAQDINDAGAYSEITGYTGTYTALSGGRSLLTLTGFGNGNNGVACGVTATPSCQFAIYPSSGGLQILEVDNLGTTNGIAYAQTGSPTIASGQGYGMNISGTNVTFTTGALEEDDIAEFTNTNGAFAGLIDFNDQGSTLSGRKLTSSYTADATISGRGTVTTPTPGSTGYDFTAYSIDGSTAVAVVTDSGFIGMGSLGLQNASVASNAAMRHLAVLRTSLPVRKSLKVRQ